MNKTTKNRIYTTSLATSLADSPPALRIPIGFAGGLHDQDLGFVRFGWRDKPAGQRI
ncbi:hypothetical protein [Pseudodesulfovibrio sp.]|uniref:hypothetical protein n=1 Tax=unclassified Pseudodesulfovibrio TaxID=2661612 RepID=UPI003B000E8D